MPRWTDVEDEWDAGPDDEDDDDEDSTIPCPSCGRDIHEDAQRCPYCESYISEEDAPPGRKPWWFVIGVCACLYVVYRWIVWW